MKEEIEKIFDRNQGISEYKMAMFTELLKIYPKELTKQERERSKMVDHRTKMKEAYQDDYGYGTGGSSDDSEEQT